MTFLPIVERELRVACHRRLTYVGRIVAALVAIIIGAWLILVSKAGAPGVLANQIFTTLSWFAFCYGLLAGVLLTADCISEEKRENTLGLLFLTDLGGHDVVLGKLIAYSLNAIYCLIAILPVMAIPLLLGGITFAHLGRTSLALINTLLFSLAIGTFASSISKQANKSTVATLALILLVLLGLPWLAQLSSPPGKFLMLPSPGVAFVTEMYSRKGAPIELFWISSFMTFMCTVSALGLASLITPRVWQDRPDSPEHMQLKERWRLWSFGNHATRAKLRRELMDLNPVLWLCGRNRLQPMLVWTSLGLVVLLWLYGCFIHNRPWHRDDATFLLTILLVNTGFQFWIAATTYQRFMEDRRSRALELLFSTPLSVKDVLAGQLQALQRQFLGPGIAIVLLDISLLIIGRHFNHLQDRELLWTFSAIIGIFVMDSITMCWLGMWKGLTAKNASRAILGPIFHIMILPWLIFIGIFLALVPLSRVFRNVGASFEAVLWIRICISLANDLLRFLLSRENLLSRFRELATHQVLERK
jgi:ABC-type transport system involved in multi-copper enzyme maturation permease subunit